MGKKIIITGGGTGGHIFPAVSIANALKRMEPETEILFVGAEGRMEMTKVPEAGYEIVGLKIQGINRKNFLKNITLPFVLFKSLRKARRLLREFKPDILVGVGGYASGPMLMCARSMDIPYVIQEQNCYAGITNIKLGGEAKKIFVAFPGMEKFFPAENIVLTGNPIRKESVDIEGKRDEALAHFNLSAAKKTILVLGGSLGSLTLNQCVIEAANAIKQEDVQVIWQCGKHYFEEYRGRLEKEGDAVSTNIKIFAFLERMDLAYAAADLIISRSGAGSAAELSAVGKPVIFVPSPHVASDHQTFNAMNFVESDACWYVKDQNARTELFSKAFELIHNEPVRKALSENIKQLAITDADEVIAKEVLRLAYYR